MADKKKLTTAEILALARQQKAGGSAEENAASGGESVPEAPPASEPAATPEAAAQQGEAAAPKPPASAPKSTADILAAARAQGGGGKPSPAKPAGGAPKSTADILAAARAQGAKPADAPKAAPKSTADILAAARAQKGGGTAPAEKPAAAKPAAGAAKAKPVVESGDRPALKDMVAAVKAAQEGQPAKLPAKTGPGTPAKPKLPKAEKVTRRSAFPMLLALIAAPFVLAWTAMAAIAGLWTLGMARFMMPNMVLELPFQFKVGPPSDFPPGTVSEKFKASRGIWIVHSDQYNGEDLIYVLSTVCTHLGCTPNWLGGEQKFKCPCHGSGFYITGINFEGPAPRPLERVGLRRAEDGMLEVDKSVKFQEELGQWSDPKSFYEVV